MGELPAGTVTFLFTDLEGSTRAWERDRAGMEDVLARHDAAVRAVIESTNGTVFTHTGDGLGAVFRAAADALRAALAIQASIGNDLKARVAIHTGEAQQRDGNYFGPTLNRVARILGAGHGGQILVSQTTEEIVGDRVPEGATLVDLGDHRLRDLSRPVRVFQLAHAALPSGFPPLLSLDRLPTNLPPQLSTFLGREEDTAALCALIPEARLVTLTGVGGVGKTRLAVQVGAEMLPSFGDGVWLCELAPVTTTDPAAVAHAIATTLGISQERGETIDQSLLESLHAKHVLLVLDNCEHLLDATGRLVDQIVHSCRRATILATSREPLGVEGERIWMVKSLASPDPDLVRTPADVEGSPAIDLFCDRAKAARADFGLTSATVGPVAAICSRLDGVPLAIELAAARTRSMTPADVAERLDERFRLLTGGPRTAIERHRTLRATVEWSYGLLSDQERTVFDRLAVFAGGFTLQSAEAVCGGDGVDAYDVVDLVTGLADKSMLQVDETGATTRYVMLETLRTFAEEQLAARGESAEVRRSHARYFRQFARETDAGLKGPDEPRWVPRIASDFDNLRAAAMWALSADDADIAIGIAADLYHYCHYWVRPEIGDWAEKAVALAGAADHAQLPSALATASIAASLRLELERAVELGEAGLRAEEEPGTVASVAIRAALANASRYALHPRALEYAEERVRFTREKGRPFDLAVALFWLSISYGAFGHEDTLPLAEEALRVADESGAPSAKAWARYAAAFALRASDPDAALAYTTEALELGRVVGGRFLLSVVPALMWQIHMQQKGDLAGGIRAGLAILDIADPSMGAFFQLPNVLGPMFMLCYLGKLDEAAVFYGAAGGGARSIPPAWQATYQEARRAIEGGVDGDRLRSQTAHGRSMSDAELISHARTVLTNALTDLQRA